MDDLEPIQFLGLEHRKVGEPDLSRAVWRTGGADVQRALAVRRILHAEYWLTVDAAGDGRASTGELEVVHVAAGVDHVRGAEADEGRRLGLVDPVQREPLSRGLDAETIPRRSVAADRYAGTP